MKRVIKILLLIIILRPVIVKAETISNVYSKAYVLYDSYEEKIIASKDTDKKYPIASLTKIMTVLVAIDNISDFDATVTVKQSDLAATPSDAFRSGLKANEEVSYNDLIYATLLPSAGDAATVLAINSTGSIIHFVNNPADLALKSREKLQMQNSDKGFK